MMLGVLWLTGSIPRERGLCVVLASGWLTACSCDWHVGT